MSNYYKYLALLLVFLNINSIQAAMKDSSESSVSPYSYPINYNSVNIGDSFLAQNKVLFEKTIDNGDSGTLKPKIFKTWVTGYSSTPGQTDSTPYLTASGNYVRTGIVAANFLPFGTRFRLPEIFGDQIFIVEDRMHPRFNDRIDVWFDNEQDAKDFGKKWSKVEIL